MAHSFALVLPLLAAALPARTHDEAPPVGDWRGTSLCLQGKLTCKDEVVVYHIAARSATAADSAAPAASVLLELKANKIVNDVEEEMGVLACTFVAASGRLTCPMPPQYAKGEWHFDRRGARMSGGLWLDGRGQFRAVELRQAGG